MRRAVHALIAQGVATEENVSGITGIGRVCRIHGRGIYRALGAGDIRHRRIASTEVLVRRLLSLDYVLEDPHMPWLPTEPEKVRAFEALGIERRLLPLRVYRGAGGNTRRRTAGTASEAQMSPEDPGGLPQGSPVTILCANKHGRLTVRVPLPSPGTGGQGEAVEFSRTKRANRGPFLFAGGVCLPRSGRPCGRTRLVRRLEAPGLPAPVPGHNGTE